MSSKLFSLLMIFLALLAGWQLYESHQRELVLSAQVEKLEHQINLLDARLAATDSAIEKLQGESLPAMVKKTNSALLDAWQGLIKNLQNQVDESRRELDDGAAEPEENGQELKRT